MAVGLLLASALQGAPPAGSRTLMEALSGATFERQRWAADGTLREAQVLTFGALQRGEPSPGVVDVPVTIADTSGGRRAQQPTDVVWRCGGDALGMLMSVATYSGSGRPLDVSLEIEGSPILYPTDVTVGDTLADLQLTVRDRGGVIGLAAARTRLSFVQRQVQAPSGGAGAYRVVSQVLARTSVFGLPVRRARLLSEAWVGPEGRLIRHRLTARDGDVWQITRRDMWPTGGTVGVEEGAGAADP